MPIRVECDACGAKYRVDDRRAGTAIPCKECDADIWVPEAPGRGGRRPARAAARARDQFDEEYAGEEGGGGNQAVLVISLVAGALVLAGIIIGVMFAMKDDPAPNQVAQKDPEDAKDNADLNPAIPNPINPIPANPNPNPINPNPVNPKPFNPRPRPVDPRPRPEPINPGRELPMPEGFREPENDPPLIPLGKWDVKFDSVSEPIAFEDERKLRVPLPTGVDVQDVLWPTAPSFFVALGNNRSERDIREVYDIRTRKKVGPIGGFRLWGGKYALSPDGKFFAVSNRESNGIYVWDVDAEKAKGTLPLVGTEGAAVLNFAGPKRLVASAGSKAPLQVWSLPDGNPERTINMPEDYVEKSVCFSHGGRYAAAYNKQKGQPTIQIFDLDTGELAGAARVPQKGDSTFWVPDCHALMFSPDGAEIAGFFEEFGQGKHFFVFSLKDGSLAFEFKMEDDWNTWWPDANATPIQWFPSRKRWLLFGNLILDRDVGKIVWKFSQEKNSAAGRRVLNDEMMMGVAIENKKPTLISFPVEEEKLAKTADAVESGGTLIDANLPPLTAIDRSRVESLTLDIGGGNWTAGPDPAPPGESPLKNSVSVTATGGRMTGLLLSNPEAGLAVVYSELRGPGIRPPRGGRGSADSGAFAHLDVYNLRTGRRTDQMDFEFPTKLASLSPSGARIASLIQPDQDRIDVWSADDGKPILALRPYSEEPDKNHRRVEALAFVDDNHLLTVNNQKKLVLWKLPECRAVYEIAQATQPGLSPNQKYLAVSTGNGYLLLDSRTGSHVGSFNIEGTMHAAAFHPDGTRFAGSCTGPRGPSIVVWSMEDGSVLTEFPLQHSAKSMHWCAGNHLLVDNETLVDVEHELIVWKYRLGTGAHSPQSPDGRHWYVAPRGASGAELIAANLPEPGVSEYLATQILKPEFLLEPGGRLTVQVNVPDSGPGQTGIRKRALENLIAKYQDHGTAVGGGSELVLTMDMKEANTGEAQQVEISKSRFPRSPIFGSSGGEQITMPLLKIECKIAFSYQGKLINEKTMTFNNKVYSERIPDGKSPQEFMSEKMWSHAANYVAGYGPPVYIFRDFEGKGLGLSTLTDQGPVPQGVSN